MTAAFEPFDLERAKRLTGDDLDALPFGVIVVDRLGTVLEYNAYESTLSGLDRPNVVGKNFFHDIAPCTAVREFEGRFTDFVDSHDTSIEPFSFLFPFTRGPAKVTIVFVRLTFDTDRATICVVRQPQ
jgi:photoactive yellow protein